MTHPSHRGWAIAGALSLVLTSALPVAAQRGGGGARGGGGGARIGGGGGGPRGGGGSRGGGGAPRGGGSRGGGLNVPFGNSGKRGGGARGGGLDLGDIERHSRRGGGRSFFYYPGWYYGPGLWGAGLYWGSPFYDPFYDPFYGYGRDRDGYGDRQSSDNVEVDVSPKNTSVYVNDLLYSQKGRTRFSLPQGSWRIDLRAPGYLPQSVEIRVEPGVHYSVRRKLEKDPSAATERDKDREKEREKDHRSDGERTQ